MLMVNMLRRLIVCLYVLGRGSLSPDPTGHPLSGRGGVGYHCERILLFTSLIYKFLSIPSKEINIGYKFSIYFRQFFIFEYKNPTIVDILAQLNGHT